ncbi:MAG: hypothetical protein N2376_06015 [Clostridia bacterium]|nr:hypothetical protein [Clostridia bacterium]
MNYIQEAEDRIKEYDQLYTAVDNIRQELAALNAEKDMLGAQKITDMPRGGSREPDDNMCNNIAKRKELRERLEITQRRIRQVENVLEKLNPEERRLVEILYVIGGKNAIKTAMEEFNIEQAHVYRRKNIVIRKIAKMFLGVGVA